MLTPFEEELEVGTRFDGRFTIQGVVGRGSMGIVYQARHELMGRTVAIKMLRGQLAGDERSMRRFEREARAASRMDHPNLIAVHDFGLTDNRQPYLVMDFAQGSTLYEIQRRENHLTPVRAVRIFTQVCDALQHAHLQGVIHRDLKPSNIMILEKDGEPDFVKVFDLGIAKIAWGEEEDKEPLTRTNEVCGSPIYLSPEQCKHETLDARSDIYSLGVVMYELLTGLPPLMGETVYDTIYMHVHEHQRAFNEVRPDLHIPSRMERIVFKALEKDADNRYQSMQELKWELQASLQASDPHLQVLPPDALFPKKNKRPSSFSGETPALPHTAFAGEANRPRTPNSSVTPVKAMSVPPELADKVAAAAYAQDPTRKQVSAAQAAIISSLVSVGITLAAVTIFYLGQKTAPQHAPGSAQQALAVPTAGAPTAMAPLPTQAPPATVFAPQPNVFAAQPAAQAQHQTALPRQHHPPVVATSPKHPTPPAKPTKHGKTPAQSSEQPAGESAPPSPNPFFSVFQGWGGQKPAPVQQPAQPQPAAQPAQQQTPPLVPLQATAQQGYPGQYSRPAQYQAPQQQQFVPQHLVQQQTPQAIAMQHQQPEEPPQPTGPTPEAVGANNEGVRLMQVDPGQAIDKFNQALAAYPGYTKARINLARAHVNMGNRLLDHDRQGALRNYREAMSIFKASGDSTGFRAAREAYDSVAGTTP